MLYVFPQNQLVAWIGSIVTRANNTNDISSEEHLCDLNASFEVYDCSMKWVKAKYKLTSFEWLVKLMSVVYSDAGAGWHNEQTRVLIKASPIDGLLFWYIHTLFYIKKLFLFIKIF